METKETLYSAQTRVCLVRYGFAQEAVWRTTLGPREHGSAWRHPMVLSTHPSTFQLAPCFQFPGDGATECNAQLSGNAPDEMEIMETKQKGKDMEWTILQDDQGYSVRFIDHGQIVILRCDCESDSKVLAAHLDAYVLSRTVGEVSF